MGPREVLSAPGGAAPRWPRARRSLLAAAALLLALAAPACGSGEPEPDPAASAQQLLALPWSEIEAQARGKTVTWAMWQGDPQINAYVSNYLAPELERRHGVKLQAVSSQGGELVSMLMTAREAGQRVSDFDLVWINGETFYQLRQIDALLGPFTDSLPNARYIDFDNPFIRYDFQQDSAGYECPWGNVQLALIYDSARVSDPPRDMAALEAWVRAHPGRFTFDTRFTGMTFLKGLLIELAGGGEALAGPFDEQRYQAASAKLWEYLERIQPFLWREGQTFPDGTPQLHQLFASGEIDFTMSNNDAEVDTKVLQGLFPQSARAYVFDSGTIQNSHYVGIVRSSGQLAAALVAVNFLIDPEAQLEKLKPAVWGDGTVLDVARLPTPFPERFRAVPERTRVPPREQLQPHALREPAAEYMIRIERDFRARLIEG